MSDTALQPEVVYVKVWKLWERETTEGEYDASLCPFCAFAIHKVEMTPGDFVFVEREDGEIRRVECGYRMEGGYLYFCRTVTLEEAKAEVAAENARMN